MSKETEEEDFLRRVSEAPARLPGSALPERLVPHSLSKKIQRRGLLHQLPAWSGLFFLVVGSRPSAATLVVFEGGRHIRVETYEVVDGDRLTVGLVGGGSMTIPLDIVERIVDDEYER
ncbi:MAG: hypothetical protein ACXVID_02480, partial [Thermoanaerobaculia bacterium]